MVHPKDSPILRGREHIIALRSIELELFVGNTPCTKVLPVNSNATLSHLERDQDNGCIHFRYCSHFQSQYHTDIRRQAQSLPPYTRLPRNRYLRPKSCFRTSRSIVKCAWVDIYQTLIESLGQMYDRLWFLHSPWCPGTFINSFQPISSLIS